MKSILTSLMTRSAIVLLLSSLSLSAHAVADSAVKWAIDIPPQNLATALEQLSRQSGTDLVYRPEQVRAYRTQGLMGTFSAEAAVRKLIQGTPLTLSTDSSGALLIAAPLAPVASPTSGPGPPTPASPPPAGDSLHLAQTTPPSAQSAPAVEKPDENERSQAEPLQEIIVTGTHLKGVTDTASPVLVFSRADIDQSGSGNVGAFIQRLPQNFNDVSETTIAGVAGSLNANNAVNAAGVDLHGMGSDATLVLVDGHRVAPGNVDGNFVDVSMIPLSAVERIEILTDGASAVYGADAVGGVVNIIMRKDFDGLETRVRAGTASDGGSHETQVGQTAGRNWGSGSALVTYEFYDRTPLSAADRRYTASAPLPFDLLPEQIRQSVFTSVDQSVANGLSVFGDALYSRRWTYTDATVVGAFSQYSPALVEQWSGTAGVRWKVSDDTELEATGGYASSDTHSAAYDAGTAAPIASSKTVTHLSTAEAILRGSFGTLPGGSVQYAIGAQFRHESFDATDYVAQTIFRPSRRVEAEFAELRFPLIAPPLAIRAVQRLVLTAADRQEHYSDFGSTNNPSLGLIWALTDALKVRGTYGRSYVAPLLSELNPVPFEIAAFNTSILPGSAPPGGDVNELVVFGGNPALKAQTARTWTMGVDWGSSGTTGPRAQLNYYVIEFSDRITNLQGAGYNVFYALPMAAVFGPQVVHLDPSAALVQQLVSAPGFVNFGATSLTDFAAVIDSRELNLSAVNSRGLDISLAYRAQPGGFSVEPGIDATYILRLTNQFTATSPTVGVVNTLYNPARVKARGHLLISKASFSLAGFVNYVGDYRNTITTQQATPIASWTTVDLIGSYGCATCEGLLRDLDISLGALNLANRAPPYAANANGFAVNYDGANASPLGRYLFVQVGKRWQP